MEEGRDPKSWIGLWCRFEGALTQPGENSSRSRVIFTDDKIEAPLVQIGWARRSPHE